MKFHITITPAPLPYVCRRQDSHDRRDAVALGGGVWQHTEGRTHSRRTGMGGIAISKAHGINGLTPEDTMRNMGLIASPGMVETEGTIVDIMRGKGSAQ